MFGGTFHIKVTLCNCESLVTICIKCRTIFALFVVLCILVHLRSTQENLTQDDPRFPSFGKHFAATPSLLTTLAAKEEIIFMVLRDLLKETGSIDGAVVDLIEKYNYSVHQIQ